MDETLKHYNPNPTLTTNPISKLFFWWLNPLFKIGYKRRLEVDDMYNVCEQDSSDNLGDRLEKEWNKELRKRESGGKPSLLKCLIRMFGVEYALLGVILFIEEGTKIAQPLFLGQLIRYFTPGSTVSSTDAYLYAMGVSLCAIILAIFHHPYFFGVQRIGMQLRVACCSLLYRKALRLNNTALGQTTTGQIVNLMSNDVNRFDTAAIFLHYLWVGPAQAIPVLIILWNELGPSAMAGFGVLLLLVPVQSWMGKLFSKFRHKTAIHTDERVKVMNEIISGMRVIKMYCWEKPFGQLVEKIRGQEVKKVKSCSYIRGSIIGFFFSSAKLIVFLTFLAYIMSGHALSTEKVFVTIALYQAIRLSTTLFIPFAIQFASETKVTVKRLQLLLLSAVAMLWVQELIVAFGFVGHIVCFWPIILVVVLSGNSFLAENVYVSITALYVLRRTFFTHVLRCLQASGEVFSTIRRVVGELKYVRQHWNLMSHSNWFFFFGQKILQLAIFLPFFLTSEKITAKNIYVAMICTNILHERCLRLGTFIFRTSFAGWVSIKRLRGEMKYIGASWKLASLSNIYFDYGHKILQIAMFVPFFLTSKKITAETIYVTVVCASLLHDRCMRFVYYQISSLVSTWVTMKRLKGELKYVRQHWNLMSHSDLCYYFGQKILQLAIFLPFFLTSDKITAKNIYVAMICTSILHDRCLRFGTFIFRTSFASWVSIKRLRSLRKWCLVEKGKEIKVLRKNFYVQIMVDILFYQGKQIFNFALLVPYFLTASQVHSEAVFVTMTCVTVMHMVWVGYGSEATCHISHSLVSVKRFKKFLLLDELKKESHLERADSVEPGDCYVSINNITGKWDPESDQTTLKDINANVQRGKLLAVIGPVGAGKSSLLMSVLGEIPLVNGDVKVHGRISYVAQQPWVFSASVRQNIVFGNKFEQSKYNRILKACALNKDIELMPNGDATLIGDRGVSLSGGQRARVSLARALYIDADVYLLDDPLSAVDAAVSRHLFEKVVLGVLKNKPVILVTHQLQFLKEADEILILKEGKCLGQGTFDEMSTSGIDFSSLLKRDKEDEEVKEEEHHQEVSYHLENAKLANIGSMMSLTSIGTEFEPDPVQLPEEEERQEGTVGWRVYYEWLRNGCGPFKFFILLLLNLLTQGLYVMSDWWLALWSNKEENKHAAISLDSELRFQGYNVTNVTIPFVDTHQNVYIFTGIIAAVFLFGLLRALMFFKVAVDSSMNMHNKMFNSLLRSPISFFDTNPVGRILNRFSKDTGHMDDLLPITLFDFIQCFLLIIGIVVVVGIVLPWVFLPLLPIGILFVVVRRYYIMTSRHIKRLEGTTRSPVFSHLSASLQGLHTIRAFGVQDKFREEFDNHQNLHTEAWFLFLATSRWLAVRLDWMCAVFVTIVAFLCVVLADSLDAGRVGLTLTYAMTLMGMFQWAVRQSAEVENQMISVERVMQYSKLPSEAELTSDKDHKPPPDWPVNGKITGEKVCLRYSDTGPMVLKYLKFCIDSKEKIGIVGRTGAGKSSLIALLFRMIEPEGKVMIDDVNIVNIGLHELRNKISIIPQDPVLFTGSLRKNLDPFGEHTDSSLWSALEEVQLKPAIEELPSQLETEVSEGGINFSVGQRQLICLARAILRRNKILMIDEATANVDPRTDALIQNTIREKFRYCTVLTIAHRLNTIMDSDRVLVLDEGNIMEFDHPYLLLQIEDGYFSKMVQQTGPSEAEHLLGIAKDTYDSSGKKVEKVISTSDVNIDESMCMKEDMSKFASMEGNGNAVMVKDSVKTELDSGKNVKQKEDQAKSDSNQNLSIDSNSVIEQDSKQLTEPTDNENLSIQHSLGSEHSPLLNQSHDHKKSHDTASKSHDTVNDAKLANGFHSDSEEAEETEHLINPDNKI